MEVDFGHQHHVHDDLAGFGSVVIWENFESSNSEDYGKRRRTSVGCSDSFMAPRLLPTASGGAQPGYSVYQLFSN